MKDNTVYEPTTAAPKSKKSIVSVLRYYFDNAITKSLNFVLFLIVIAFMLGLLMTFIQAWHDGKPTSPFFDRWWTSVTKILKLGAGKDWYGRVTAFLFWSFSIAISGTIIGFLSSKIREVVANLKKGKSTVIVKKHTVILGWSTSIFPILKELSRANENGSKGTVVIFSKTGNEEMQDQLKTIAEDTKRLKIVTRSGDPENAKELLLANPRQAKAIIVLNEGGANDPKVITTVLALGTILNDNSIPVIASLNNVTYADIVSSLEQTRVIPVLAENIVANVTAQACRQRGLGMVFLDLLDFDGDEIYFKSVPELTGKTYHEALVSFNNSSLLGIISNEEIRLIPSSHTVINDGDKLIFISADDDTIHYKRADIEQYTHIKKQKYKKSIDPRDVLFIGWSNTGNKILDALMPSLSKNSKITVAYQTNIIDKENIPTKKQYNMVKYSNVEVKDDFSNIADILDKGKYDDVMILGYAEKLSIEEADTTTLMYLLKLDQYLAKHENKPFRVVAQVLDSAKADLAKFTKTDELIISDNLSGLLMAQLAENPKLKSVFADLFDEDKSNISINPMSKYVKTGSTVTYGDIVYSAGLHNESAIGYRRDGISSSSHAEGLFLNPEKSIEIETKDKDFVIVISKPV